MRMQCFRWRVPVIFLFIGALFLHTKLEKSSETLAFLRDATDEFKTDIFAGGPDLDEVLQKIHSPAILLLNRHALKITLNFLCNVRQFNGVLDRIVVFAFDYHSKVVIRSSFPSVNVILFRYPQLEDRFAAGSGRYQLFQFFRAQLSAYLTTKVESFWMIQSDTVWRKNLFEVFDVSNLKQDLLFDCEGEYGLLSKMIAGGYYYVKSNERTHQFFSNIAATLLDYYVTDNNLMARQCLLGMFGNECAFMSYKLIVNWRYTPVDGEPDPPFLQFDGGENPAEKFKQMDKQGALFVDPETLSDEQWVARCLEDRVVDDKKSGHIRKPNNKSNFVIRFFHSTFELLCAVVPGLERLTLAYIFPFYAYYLAI